MSYAKILIVRSSKALILSYILSSSSTQERFFLQKLDQ